MKIMNFYRPTVAVLLSVLLLEAGVFFHLYDMQSAVPRIRTLMPARMPEAAAGKPPGEAAARAQALCLSDTPLQEGGRTQMDYCMMSAGAGDPASQAAVAEFYLDGTTPASQTQAYAWLRTASANSRDPSVAAAARAELDGLMRQLDAATIERAEALAAKYMRKYGR